MCRHEAYQAAFDMNRLSGDDPDRAIAYVGELMVRCKECGQRFVFKTTRGHETGVPEGIIADPTGTILYIPMEPEDEPTPTFTTPKKPSVH